MSPRARRRALVVVRDGPAGERGWLALRTALALGLGGFDVGVWLEGEAVAFAAAGLDARAWLGGDPGADVAGLVDDAGAEVHALLGAEPPGGLRDGVLRSGVGTLARLYAGADVVLVP